jgi:hypothetical protein
MAREMGVGAAVRKGARRTELSYVSRGLSFSKTAVNPRHPGLDADSGLCLIAALNGSSKENLRNSGQTLTASKTIERAAVAVRQSASAIEGFSARALTRPSIAITVALFATTISALSLLAHSVK